jgi:hypothetical protein
MMQVQQRSFGLLFVCPIFCDIHSCCLSLDNMNQMGAYRFCILYCINAFGFLVILATVVCIKHLSTLI